MAWKESAPAPAPAAAPAPVEPLFSSGASSTYHALQVTAKKRLSMGLQFEGFYTWSKSIDNGEGGYEDAFRIKLNRAITDLDVPHRFILNYVYELPFGRNRRFGTDMPRLLDAFLGGWMLDGITNYQSGGAFGVSGNNVCRCFNNGSYANSKGYSGRLEGRPEDRLARWFDTKAFSQPDPFTIGNMGRDRATCETTRSPTGTWASRRTSTPSSG